ncbi:MAG TPA: DoxX family protein [Pseudonocardia sp.]|mgnify:CR=1 FL=1|jgi:uncharacterized membrane protein YphA (DoxX/SURF4 family)|uniref:DoxX family protein n=1 Tax=Pseudonocardia sp. TaxID=60912 RepID=UPI002B4B2B73|nr:DoxX family protein [Pseudonocardia sp.]HLU54720.1 DoxX family protein [Pseudonocardia sp.]
MTELATDPTARRRAPRTPSRATSVTLWTLQILVGLFLVVASAAPKFWGDPYAIQIFDEIGAGQWFRYVTGAVELAGGLGLMIPRLAGPAAVGLMGFMVCAAYTQAVVLDQPTLVITPAIIFVIVALIAWGRRESIAAWLPAR